MTDLGITLHASERMSQRGIRHSDLSLLMQIRTEVEDGYIVLKKDYERFEHRLRQLAQPGEVFGW